jgi:hypothetical protein
VKAFTFTDESDIAEYSADDIVTILHHPKESRGIYYFSEYFTLYRNTLH